jgi:hypothetical protein
MTVAFARWPVHPERTRRRRLDEGPAHLLIIHTSEQNTNGTETAERLGLAVGQPATRDSAGKIVNQASYHWAVDTDSVAGLVLPDDIAYHAPPNWRGEGLCLTGRAGRDWTTGDVAAQLDLAARLAADILTVRRWPNRVLTVDEIRAGEPGMCGHVSISAAFGLTDHYDPGPSFPWSTFSALIDHHLDPPPPGAPMSTARRVRIRGYHNVFLIGTGPPVHLTPELDATYTDVPLVVIDLHTQFLEVLLWQTGLSVDNLVPSGEL